MAQASRLCNLLKSREELYPTGNNPAASIFLPGAVKKGRFFPPRNEPLLWSRYYWDGRKWTLYAAVIMPDHVHALVQPLALPECAGVYDLAEIIHSVKSFSVHQINRLRGSRGSLWQDERYDRIIRDEEEFLGKWQYIMNNPLKNELVQRWEDYAWLYIKNN